jgi:hypothetical protein
MKKRSMHRIHIDEDTYKWYVSTKSSLHSLVIFDPRGKRHQVTGSKYLQSRGVEKESADQQWKDDLIIFIPIEVKEFIVENIAE